MGNWWVMILLLVSIYECSVNLQRSLLFLSYTHSWFLYKPANYWRWIRHSVAPHGLFSAGLLNQDTASNEMSIVTRMRDQKSIFNPFPLHFFSTVKATGPQLKEAGFDSAGMMESTSVEKALNGPAGGGSPLGQHVRPEERAESSSPCSTPAGRGEFCFLRFERSELNIASENNRLGVASVPYCP